MHTKGTVSLSFMEHARNFALELIVPSLIPAHQPSRCYYCTIAKDRVWSNSMGFCVLCRNVSRSLRLQEQVMWLINHFDDIRNVLLFALPLAANSSNLLKMWPGGVGTVEH